jgi:hypothetical protein
MVDSFWIVGTAAAVLYFVCARFKPRLGVVAFIPAALWFVSLFLEIHSPDVGPHLGLEQGSGYYMHAYVALALAACGLAAGYTRHRHQTKKRCRAAFRFPIPQTDVVVSDCQSCPRLPCSWLATLARGSTCVGQR